MKNYILSLFSLLSILTYSQNNQGKIVFKYEKKENNTINNPTDFFLSDIVDYSMRENKILYFNGNETNFVSKNTVSNNMYNIINTDVLYINFDDNNYIETQEVFGKEFIIKDTISKIKWDTNYKETLDILNFKCSKATTKFNDDNLITIWYTKEIDATAGPSFYFLPKAVILKIELKNIVIKANSIDFEKPIIKIPIGKVMVSKKEFDKIFKEKLEEIKNMKN